MSGKAFNLSSNDLGEWIGEVLEGPNPFAQVTEEKIKEMHALAYHLYRNKQYQEANDLFRFLVLIRSDKATYWKGLGACLQMQQDYEQAINCYKYAQRLNQASPDPYLYVHTADCYFALKQIEAGLMQLEAARSQAENTQDDQMLHHVALMREVWSR